MYGSYRIARMRLPSGSYPLPWTSSFETAAMSPYWWGSPIALWLIEHHILVLLLMLRCSEGDSDHMNREEFPTQLLFIEEIDYSMYTLSLPYEWLQSGPN